MYLDSPRLVIDTDIIVDYLRRGSESLEAALLRYECMMTAITLYELRAIPGQSQRQERMVDQLQAVLDVVPFSARAAIRAAETWVVLQRQGMSIGLPDTLIAGTCLAEDIPLLTRNQAHYHRVPDLVVLTPDDLLKT